MTIRLLIADVDGTLVTATRSLTARTCEAVERLRAAGVGFTDHQRAPAARDGDAGRAARAHAPVAAFNGGMYVKPDLTTVLAQRTIPPDGGAGRRWTTCCGGPRRLGLPGRRLVRPQSSTRRASRASAATSASRRWSIADLHAVLDAPVKIVGVSEDHALVARCEAELAARLGADASAARSQPYYLDVTHPEANKGMVVREARAHPADSPRRRSRPSATCPTTCRC